MSAPLYFMSTVDANMVWVLIRVLPIVLLIKNNTTSHQVLSWIDTEILLGQLGLCLYDDPLLLRDGRLLIIGLISILDTFPIIEATGELSVHYCGWSMQITA